MEVWKCDVVPGETSGGASFEGWDVICEVGDDHLQDLVREPAQLMRVSGIAWVPVRERALDSDFGTVPGNEVSDELATCNDKLHTGSRGEEFAEYLVAGVWGS